MEPMARAEAEEARAEARAEAEEARAEARLRRQGLRQGLRIVGVSWRKDSW